MFEMKNFFVQKDTQKIMTSWKWSNFTVTSNEYELLLFYSFTLFQLLKSIHTFNSSWYVRLVVNGLVLCNCLHCDENLVERMFFKYLSFLFCGMGNINSDGGGGYEDKISLSLCNRSNRFESNQTLNQYKIHCLPCTHTYAFNKH